MVRVGVIRFPGSNCEEETLRAARRVGAEAIEIWHRDTDLKGADVLQPEPIRRTVEMPTELRNGMKIGSLRGRRQVAKRHVVDHTAAQRAYR